MFAGGVMTVSVLLSSILVLMIWKSSHRLNFATFGDPHAILSA